MTPARRLRDVDGLRAEIDQARQACVDYISEAQLDAEMCERTHPELLVELREIFDVHNPSSSGGSEPPRDDADDVDTEDVDAPEPVEA